ncbi:uncharacterized protein DFL_003727 [Arthrobotrys flagrans]|uniref:Uncharacterized protein n=1 Tax=Arthrobotrys flagrans TaxID=97331 RepID=A0A437A2Q1_ARTFL|nr:hypothetical protein DFL_003727 [Arthrobotrys flagrans]
MQAGAFEQPPGQTPGRQRTHKPPALLLHDEVSLESFGHFEGLFHIVSSVECCSTECEGDADDDDDDTDENNTNGDDYDDDYNGDDIYGDTSVIEIALRNANRNTHSRQFAGPRPPFAIGSCLRRNLM